jgi:chromosome segregation ATPase
MVEDQTLLQKQYTEINTHYVRLYEEAKHLMYDLERKEHDINYMKATIQELNEGKTSIC